MPEYTGTIAGSAAPGIPTIPVSTGDVSATAKALAPTVRQALSESGAALLRGFESLNTADFAAVAHAFIDDISADNAEHERVDDSGVVQTPVPYSSHRKLLWHNENSFNRRWPRTLIFSPTVVATTGGRTPLTDSRRLLRIVDPAIVTRFRERGVAYIRRFGRGIGLPWQQVLGTDDRPTADRRSVADGVELAWGPDDTLSTRAVRPAVIDHPLTGESAWFAQPAHWHPACLDEETRDALLDVFGQDGLPRDCRFGDGSTIPDSMMHELLEAHASIERSFDWKVGDVLAIDNVLTAHARNPYTGARRLLVAMGDQHEFAERIGPATLKTPS